MKVSAQYAGEHFADILHAADNGEEVEIARPDKASIKRTLVPVAEKFDRSGMFGWGKGKVWISDDFDSPEASGENS